MRLFEVGRLLTCLAFRVAAHSKTCGTLQIAPFFGFDFGKIVFSRIRVNNTFTPFSLLK